MKARTIIPVVFVFVAASCEAEVESRVRVGPRQPPPAAAPAPPLPPEDFPVAAPDVAADGCHPSYDPCVPIASDVDCAGGGGNGPAYVHGPVRVIGRDVYQLDRDGDGLACDRWGR